MSTVHEDQYTFLIYLTEFILEWELFRTKVGENFITHVLCSITFFKNCAIREIMRKNVVESGRSQMTIWCMRIACWIPKATTTHSECVILIAFPLKLCLHKCTSVLCYATWSVLLLPSSGLHPKHQTHHQLPDLCNCSSLTPSFIALKMTTVLFAEMSGNLHSCTRPNPKSHWTHLMQAMKATELQHFNLVCWVVINHLMPNYCLSHYWT
jgi:hypothetical protein